MILKSVVQAHLEKKAIRQCEACGGLDWVIPSDDNISDVSIICDLHIRQSKVVMLPSPSVPTIVVACTNCGYIRLFALNMIQPPK